MVHFISITKYEPKSELNPQKLLKPKIVLWLELLLFKKDLYCILRVKKLNKLTFKYNGSMEQYCVSNSFRCFKKYTRLLIELCLWFLFVTALWIISVFNTYVFEVVWSINHLILYVMRINEIKWVYYQWFYLSNPKIKVFKIYS